MSKFFKDTSFSFVGQIIVMAFGVVTGIVLARLLGNVGRGIWAGIFLVPETLNALLASGFGSSIVFFTSSKKWSEQEALSNVLGITAYIVCVVLAAGILVVSLCMRWLDPLPQSLLFLGLVAIPIALTRMSFMCLLTGRQDFRSVFQNNVSSAVANFVCMMTAIYFSPTVQGALAGYVAGALISLAILVFTIHRTYSGCVWRPETNWRNLKPAFSYGGRVHVANAVGFLNYRADQFIVNAMLGTASLGVYCVAVALAERLWLVVSHASAVLMPRVASAQKDKRTAEITSQLARVMLLVLLIAMCGMALLALLIPLVYGAQFGDAVHVLWVLLPGVAAMGYTKVFGNYLAAVGRPEINARNAGVGLVLNLVANVILIPWLGLLGAAVATSLSYSTICVLAFSSYLSLTGTRWHESVLPRKQDATRLVSMVRSVLPA